MQWRVGPVGTATRTHQLGETQDFSVVLGSSLPYFLGAARKISNSTEVVIHEDMVQGAITKFIEHEQTHPGVVSNIRQYVITVMRNAAIDAARSQQAKVMPLDVETFSIPNDESGFHEVENATERAIVRRALSRLSRDHQTVLLGYADGLRPRDLVTELGRDAAAVSALHKRATSALRRYTLIEVLARGGRDCRTNAESLPPKVWVDLEQHSEHDSGLRHIMRCHKCRENWRRFSLLKSAFSLLPFLII